MKRHSNPATFLPLSSLATALFAVVVVFAIVVPIATGACLGHQLQSIPTHTPITASSTAKITCTTVATLLPKATSEHNSLLISRGPDPAPESDLARSSSIRIKPCLDRLESLQAFQPLRI